MNPILAAAALLALCFPMPAWSRASAELPFEQMAAQADVIAIIETIENQTVDDVFPSGATGSGLPAENFEATNTRFKVHTFIKGGDAPKELTLLHFGYSSQVRVVINGAQFIEFPKGPIEYEKPAPPHQPDAKPTLAYRDAAIWLAFLKRRPDGRYEPVTGQYDSRHSFRELRKAPLSVPFAQGK